MWFTADFYGLLCVVDSHFWFMCTSEEIMTYNHAYSEFHHCQPFYVENKFKCKNAYFSFKKLVRIEFEFKILLSSIT